MQSSSPYYEAAINASHLSVPAMKRPVIVSDGKLVDWDEYVEAIAQQESQERDLRHERAEDLGAANGQQVTRSARR